ncbi:Zn-dependent hydrolase [Gloeocapsopsis dulcis]|uniref:Zn-dependent hydrolase n=1 Tax=Gloeocapsopsis dulcis AAB1 = 1H9 TaxID=1433147 RepID=A0A6N8FYW5_9CHRO|nr:Zn-dependent hydrolase [Gloeocapsopsis dulcis]MUL38273.1 Zn-dependent hydrolase [Gloeocapsopsis dulcis AAB1 = 1H9]WNN89337.1 Zn-dependent hydrolase [Gloeocapsopsis dulcis]
MTVALIPVVNGDRLNRNIAQLAEIGKLPGGGVSRVAFTPEDLLARQLVQSWMVEAGMTVRIDAAGNIIGTYAGKQEGVGALATGSHIDTVPVAGKFDGVLGVLAGIEVIHVLQENKIRLQHPLEVIVFTDEENSVLGCKAMAGTAVLDPECYRRNDGMPIETCLAQIGGDWSQLATAKRQPSDIAAFVELHVEQGGLLESTKDEVGVVIGIVGQYRHHVTVTGLPNHAGTTPMNMRKDALVAASQIVLAVNKLATETPGEQVATVGYFCVSPNAANIVPARVDLKIDLRDLSQIHLEDMVAQIKNQLGDIAAATQTEIDMTQMLHVLPTLAAPHIQEAIAQVCQQLGLSYTYLPSRAGHDAQEIGRFADMGMIFVPSHAGISHAEDEYTSPEQCTQGANVLLQTFLKLDEIY